MNFKKNKDVKRASYYVWFLGSKESKGLRGDEYVTPVLNFLLDSECAEFEPSKVTLQVSNKGLKIIQILTVPRKSSKLSAEQQLQLFASSRRSKSDLPPPSSVLKTEQVKHHIPHNSITWVYQEEDIICAILLLYNPITRCPVHVHAYRCDSIETATTLRQQLQTLVDRQENQKKFREIEARLVAKGLLLSPQHFNFPEEDLLPHSRSYNSRSTSKTLNSDGRSTRTEGSDENSEESNSSDLGYAIRSKSTNLNGAYKPANKIEKTKHDRVELGKGKSKLSKAKKMIDEADLPSETATTLYDSVAAELRAKLGNPKIGPILLPPRDYDSGKTRANNQERQLKRSESSGKSSSGIGSDEALSGENQKSKSSSQYYRSHYESHGPQSLHDPPPKRYLFPNDKSTQMFSLQMYSSDEENFDSSNHVSEGNAEDIEEDVVFTTACKSKSTYDLTSFDMKRASHNNSEHKQTPPPPAQHSSKYLRQHQGDNIPINYDLERKVKNAARAKMFASNPNLSAMKVEAPVASKPEKFVIGRREQRSMQSQHHHRVSQQQPPGKFYFADPRSEKPTGYKEGRQMGRTGLPPPPPPFSHHDYSGPVSLNYHQINVHHRERSISPYFYSTSDHYDKPPTKHYVPSKQSSKVDPPPPPTSQHLQEIKNHQLAMKKKLEQPYSRYSYIDTDYYESRFNYRR